MRCDLVIPAFNEAANIGALYDALEAQRHLVRHIVVGDNNSTDGTDAIARERGAAVVIENNRGYGAACLAALAWIDRLNDPPDVVAFLDADLSDDPAELERLLEPVAAGRAELVIGSRVRLAEPGALNAAQRFGGWLACRLIAFTAGRQYSDLGPFRVITWAALQQLDMRDRTWGWTVEMQMKAALLGIPNEEVDVRYRPRHAGRSKISGTVRGVVAAGTKIIATIFALWWRRRSLRRQGDQAMPRTATGSDGPPR